MSVLEPDITVGPSIISINDGFTVMTSDPDGQISDNSEQGLYFRDTRMISGYRIGVSGERWELLNAAAIIHYGARIHLTNPKLIDEAGEIAAHSLGLDIGRTVGDGLHEDFDLTNFGSRPVRISLELEVRSDFADIFDVRKKHRVTRGEARTTWSDTEPLLTTIYTSGAFRRGHRIQIRNAESSPTFANGRLTFQIVLAPWSAPPHDASI